MMEQSKSCQKSRWIKMQRVKPLVFAGIMVLGVSVGCTASASDKSDRQSWKVFSPENCIGKIDWSQVGLADGRLGIEPSYFNFYVQRCARWSRKPDKKAYFQAYQRGIMSYCTPENIYQLARSGAVAIDSCKNTAAIRKAVQDGFANLLNQ